MSGLGEARYRKLDTYSLGMKQLAKLAQAIVHGPKLIFLDEPTNGLDPPAAAANDQVDSRDSRQRPGAISFCRRTCCATSKSAAKRF